MKTVPRYPQPLVLPCFTFLHLSEASLCVDCNMIHDQKACPCCASTSSLALWGVLNRRLALTSTETLPRPELAVKLVVDEGLRDERSPGGVLAAVAE